ncbi:helix-turn-helix transcriptional regulator [Tsukamurella soli]|uniref:Helix-turn-helix transcriptional regulator n=1 Tax=Tsukamurella soli TaxID=644556 RepID=A0ABP8J1T3_9ACTN
MSDIGQWHPQPTASQTRAAGEHIERHYHDEHQVAYTSSGATAVTTARGTWIAPRDRAVWIPACTWHEHRFHGPARFHCVAFDPAVHSLDSDGPTVMTVTPLLRELIVACSDPVGLGADEAERLRTVLVDQLRRRPREPLSVAEPSDPRLIQARDEIVADLSQPVGIKRLAARCATSERTLSRLIRAELGMSYPQWRAQLRLHQALILLVEGESVTTTAVRCGWPTPSAFIDAFRGTYGRTPGSYAESPA